MTKCITCANRAWNIHWQLDTRRIFEYLKNHSIISDQIGYATTFSLKIDIFAVLIDVPDSV